jgi:hypothetical protein
VKLARRTSGKSYDEWFTARTPATRVQFLGLLPIGAMLIATGLSVLVVMWSKGLSDPVDGFVIILLSMCSIPGLAIIYFGVLHIKRVLAGRK